MGSTSATPATTTKIIKHANPPRPAAPPPRLRREVRNTEAGLIRIMGTPAELSALSQEVGS